MNEQIGAGILGAAIAALITLGLDYFYVVRKIRKGSSQPSEEHARALNERTQESIQLRQSLEEVQRDRQSLVAQISELEARTPPAANEVDTSLYVQRVEELMSQLSQEKRDKYDLEQRLAQAPNLSAEADLLKHRIQHLEGELVSTYSRAEQAEQFAKDLQETINQSNSKENNDGQKEQLQSENEHLRKLVQNMRTQSEEVEALQAKILALESELGAVRSNESPINSEAMESLQAELATKSQQLETLMRSNALLDGDKMRLEEELRELKATSSGIEGLQGEHEKLSATVQELQQQLATASSEANQNASYLSKFESAQDDLERLKAELSAKEDELNGLRGTADEAQSYQSQWEDAQREINALTVQLKEKESTFASLQGDSENLNEAQSKIADLLTKLGERESIVTSLQNDLANLGETKSDLSNLVGKYAEKEEETARLSALVQSNQDQMTQAQQEISSLRASLEEAQSQAQGVQDAQRAIQTAEARNEELTAQFSSIRAQFEAKQLEIEESKVAMEKALQAELESTRSSLSEARAKAEAISNEYNLTFERVGALEEQLATSKTEAAKVASSLAELENSASLQTTKLNDISAVLDEVRLENQRLRKLADDGVATSAEIDPLHKRINELFANLEDSRRENEGIRKAMESTLSDLRRLRYEMIELGRLREENARLKAQSGPIAEVHTLRSRVSEADTIILQAKSETKETAGALDQVNQEIGDLRQQLRSAIDLGELS